MLFNGIIFFNVFPFSVVRSVWQRPDSAPRPHNHYHAPAPASQHDQAASAPPPRAVPGPEVQVRAVGGAGLLPRPQVLLLHEEALPALLPPLPPFALAIKLTKVSEILPACLLLIIHVVSLP